jgi:hypothetical protein
MPCDDPEPDFCLEIVSNPDISVSIAIHSRFRSRLISSIVQGNRSKHHCTACCTFSSQTMPNRSELPSIHKHSSVWYAISSRLYPSAPELDVFVIDCGVSFAIQRTSLSRHISKHICGFHKSYDRLLNPVEDAGVELVRRAYRNYGMPCQAVLFIYLQLSTDGVLCTAYNHYDRVCHT